MKSKTTAGYLVGFKPALTVIGLLILQLYLLLIPVGLHAADAPGVVDRTKETVKEAGTAVESAAKTAKESVQDAGRAVGNGFENLWRRISESRLKNRTRDEIVAWVIMGVLAGAVAGMLTKLKTTGLGQLGRLMLGLAGALIGGMIVHVGRIDFGLGPVLIRYEELLFSLVGAVVLIVGARFFRGSAKKKTAQK